MLLMGPRSQDPANTEALIELGMAMGTLAESASESLSFFIPIILHCAVRLKTGRLARVWRASVWSFRRSFRVLRRRGRPTIYRTMARCRH